MNMYTKPKYRRQGIAYKTLDLLVKAAKKRDHSNLPGSYRHGPALYGKWVCEMEHEMELPE